MAQAEVFEQLFFVFLALGTAVGVVVVSYTLYNAYKYRDREGREPDENPPVLGELPTGADKGGKKLFLSFGISAIIVVSLVFYAYTLLIYVEEGPATDVETEMDVEVEGYQFGWEFEYPNGETTDNELRVPEGTVVGLSVTSRDVWHTFGVTELRVKADSIPGQTDNTWFIADEPGTYQVECFELCGPGHSIMEGEIIVMEEEAFEEWYENMDAEDDSTDETDGDDEDGDSE
ncbi:MAG: cytochrome c oxidase subunit II [Halobacteriota archaeon]